MLKIALVLCCLIVGTVLMGQEANEFKAEFLNQMARIYKLDQADISDYQITDNYIDASTNVRHVYLQQQVNGIKIYNAIISLHIGPEGKLIHSTSRFVSEAAGRINTVKASRRAEEALVFASVHLNLPAPSDLKVMKQGMFNAAGVSRQDIPFNLIYQLDRDGRLVLCWDFIIQEINTSNWWDIRVDANTGQVLDKTNWTISCNWDHGGFERRTHDHEGDVVENLKMNVDKSGLASFSNPDSYNVFPLGIESPIHGTRSVVINPADAVASPFGWHDTDGISGSEYTTTRGNNVFSYEDRDANNLPGFSPDGGMSLDFNFPLDESMPPASNESAILSNLFYWNNVMHDIWYQYGFDEASGNFQANNYGRGGKGADFVFAEAQDGSGTNNANFSAPPDSLNPRMQMFLWSGETADPMLTVNSPNGITLSDGAKAANFGSMNYNVTAEIVIVDDGTAQASLGCNDLVNGSAIDGKIALVDRGACAFSFKALRAQNAGAIAVIICNNVAGPPFAMEPGAFGSMVTIPVIMISQADCQILKNALPGVNLTMQYDKIYFDSGLDNGVIAHEYGHGISIRLTGGPATNCMNNDEQMGEGWSDWFGLMVTMNPGDMGTDARGIGTYVLGETTAGTGLRVYPYSTDLGVNPHTYNAIKTAVLPHGVGSVWCAMLWEMTWMLIDEYGFDPDLYGGTGGNNIAMTLIIEGLKLQPCNPGFIDGRDAILAADQIHYGGANQCLIWEAFAKRGLGFSAHQGSSLSITDGTEAFDMPPSCILNTVKSVDKLNASAGDTLIYTIDLHNTSGTILTNVVVIDSIPDHTSYLAGSATNGGVLDNGAVIFPAASFAVDQVETYSFSVIINPGIDPSAFSTIEDAETFTMDWLASASNTNLGIWSITNTNPFAGSGVWFAPDVPMPNEEYLTLADPILPSDSTLLKFWHSYDTEETWDGGLVQISKDNQKSWQDLGTLFTQNGYNSTIDQNANTPAFSGNSGGYIESIVDLSSFSDQAVFIRFWMHCDPLEATLGWYVDNIEITNLHVLIPNMVMVTADGIDEINATLTHPTKVDKAICDDVIIFPGPIVSTNDEFRANVQIQSSFAINGNSVVSFVAGDNLLFNSGFEVEAGSSLIADIGPCDGPTLLKYSGNSTLQSNISDIQVENKTSAEKVSLDLQLEENSSVKVVLQNLLGEVVRKVEMKEFQKTGKHRIDLDVHGLTSGIYLLNTWISNEQFITRIHKYFLE